MEPTACPHNVSTEDGRRKSWYPGESRATGVEKVGAVWQVRSMPAARALLRSRDTTQAGFNAEAIMATGIRMPILFADGPEHRTQRSAIARYFAPRTVESKYHQLMEQQADELVAQLQRERRCDLAELSMRYSVAVAAQVVGLTESSPEGMAGRLNRFFATPVVIPGADGGPTTLRSRFDAITMTAKGQWPMLAFWWHDVRPAVAARRRTRQDDVVSHLLDEGYSRAEILVECITYAAAGMVTTREFISMATWHLLEDGALRERYLAAEWPEREEILLEVLRLEPVVGHVLRRTTAPVDVGEGDEAVTIPAGELVDVFVRNGNADPAVVGEQPVGLCPGRSLPPRVGEEVMSFGDGAHRCPGNALAIQEADVLLTRMLKLPVRLATTPRIQWDELIRGYEVRDIALELAPA